FRCVTYRSSDAMAEVYSRVTEGAGTIPFTVRTVWTPLCACVHLVGELDLSGVETVNACVDALLSVEGGSTRVIVDLHELCFADVVGIRTVVLACRRLRRIGPLEVCGVRPSVQRVLELASLTLSGVCDRVQTTPVRPGRLRSTGV